MKIHIDKDSITWRKLRDELVLMHLDTGAYYSLNESGVIIWQGIVDERPHEDIVNDMSEMFDVDRETIARDFERIVNELADQGLVELVDEEVKG
ncbi:MAG TPA: PqqD family protein [candidate division Zixibacteria bacterium]|nr:PqqD family protein [candidate division Zixibacteria bacterium]